MAEQFVFNQRIRQRTGRKGDKWLIGALAQAMNRLSNNALCTLSRALTP